MTGTFNATTAGGGSITVTWTTAPGQIPPAPPPAGAPVPRRPYPGAPPALCAAAA